MVGFPRGMLRISRSMVGVPGYDKYIHGHDILIIPLGTSNICHDIQGTLNISHDIFDNLQGTPCTYLMI